MCRLVANKELNLHVRPDGSTRYNLDPDFKFVIMKNFFPWKMSLQFAKDYF